MIQNIFDCTFIFTSANSDELQFFICIILASTADGELCQIPFKYEKNGPSYTKCTTKGTSKGEWCATTVNKDLTYDNWDWC